MGNVIKCPNGSSEAVILNAAIPSWAGFLYQGLCALCVAMEKLLTEQDAKDWYLNIEGYEDFAILDANKQILSFHQCKDYKNRQSWKAEFEKMEDKRFYWSQKGMCKPDTPLYFHTNLEVDYSNGVVCYSYKNGSSVPNTLEIFDMLSDLVDEYSQKENIPVSVDRAKNRLMALMERHINSLDVEDKKTVNQTQKISIANSIPFSRIVDVIRTAEDDRTLDEKVRLSIFYINLYLTNRLDELGKLDSGSYVDRIVGFLDKVNGMDKESKKYLVQRLFPDINIEDSGSTIEISNSPRVNYLFNLLIGTQEEMDLEQMHWLNDGIRQSPSTMGNDKSPEEYCRKIVRNQTLPPEILRDYDWIVGCFTHTVKDIWKAVPNITRVGPIKYYDITKVRKTGLLSIKDKNDGRLQ